MRRRGGASIASGYEGWLGELAYDWLRVMADLERDDEWQFPAPPTWTDSKQRRREALKKLAMGQKFGGQSHEQQIMYSKRHK